MAGSGTAHLLPAEDALLRVEHLVVEYPHGIGEKVHAVSDVSLDVRRGETLGIVGESGCGKSTLARAIMQLVPVTSGTVVVGEHTLTDLKGRALRAARLRVQMIFQDPISSLNPRQKVKDIVSAGLSVWGKTRRDLSPERADEVLEAVGLDPHVVGNRRPREFSGGQCQRISIARALVMDPAVLICDEPVSSLDVSVQAQILNLLEAMKARYGLTMIFIAHDLAVVKNISDRIAVMYLGKICEVAPSDRLYEEPLHPYTLGLLEAIPEPDPDAAVVARELVGDAPSPTRPPSGCRFRTRCPRASEHCRREEPEIRELRPGHFVACHHPLTDGAQ
jgi:peptide/nickel transport system ATP-binding protein